MNLKPYLKYIYEVLAIVVGITISFMVDEWREERQNRDKENKLLIDFRNVLVDGIVETNNAITESDSLRKRLFCLKDHIYNKGTYHDSLEIYIRRSHWRRILQINKSPYAHLKSIGFDKIKNDKLRQSIMNLYEYTLLEVEKGEEYSINTYYSYILDFHSRNARSWDWFNKLDLIDPENMIKSDEFKFYIDQNLTLRSLEIHNYETLLSESKKVLNLIIEELDK